MESAARVCAIVTGSVAFACGVVALSWWFDSGWLVYSSGAVQLVAFMTGFLGFVVMFGMLLDRAGGRKPTIRRSEILSLVLSKVPRRRVANDVYA